MLKINLCPRPVYFFVELFKVGKINLQSFENRHPGAYFQDCPCLNFPLADQRFFSPVRQFPINNRSQGWHLKMCDHSSNP